MVNENNPNKDSKNSEENKESKKNLKKSDLENFPTLNIKKERDIAMDFSQKIYQKFDKLIKSIIIFGSTVKNATVPGSDIDIIIIVDDVMVRFDNKLILWYREELARIIQENPYNKELHINTVKLTTWWQDLLRGDPTIINIIRYGESIIDFGGFFSPLKILLDEGKIKPTPEAIYTCLNRVPDHIFRSKQAQLTSIEGYYWSMVDTAQALLMAARVLPPSPEHIAILLKENFVDKNLLKLKHVTDFKNIQDIHKKYMHGELKDIDGRILDEMQKNCEDFFDSAIELVKRII